VLRPRPVERGPDGGGVRDVLPAGDGDQGALGQVRTGLALLAGAAKVAGVDGGGGKPAGPAGVRSLARAPDVAGLDAVRFRREVAHRLEGVAAVAEVPGALGEALQLDGLHFAAVLGAFEVAHLEHDPVGRPVDAARLRVQHVHEMPSFVIVIEKHVE